MSNHVAVKTAAAAELSSPSTLRAVSQLFAASIVFTPSCTPVDCSHPPHPFYLRESGQSLESQLLVHRLLREVAFEITIHGEKFNGWIRQRLFSTVQWLYLGKKMYLVLDNAKFHHHRGPDSFSLSQKEKGQLADFPSSARCQQHPCCLSTMSANSSQQLQRGC